MFILIAGRYNMYWSPRFSRIITNWVIGLILFTGAAAALYWYFFGVSLLSVVITCLLILLQITVVPWVIAWIYAHFM